MPKVLQPLQRITNGNMAGNLTSGVVDGRYLTNIKWQGVWTGVSPTGSFSLQESLNYNPVTGVGDWYDNGAGISNASGSANSFYVNLLNRAPAFYRLVFTAGGGSVGTLNAWASGSGPL